MLQQLLNSSLDTIKMMSYERHGATNHRQPDRLVKSFWLTTKRHQIAELLAFCDGDTGGFPAQRGSNTEKWAHVMTPLCRWWSGSERCQILFALYVELCWAGTHKHRSHRFVIHPNKMSFKLIRSLYVPESPIHGLCSHSKCCCLINM